MKYIQILFATKMVNSLLADLKSKTRRIRGLKEINENPKDWEFVEWDITDEYLFAIFRNEKLQKVVRIKCPYGTPGDRLWVRETWDAVFDINGVGHAAKEISKELRTEKNCCQVLYLAGNNHFARRWMPSIFMPRWASRILLENVSVKCERLEEVTEEEAIAEGFYGFLSDDDDCQIDWSNQRDNHINVIMPKIIQIDKTPREQFFDYIIARNKAKNRERFLQNWAWVIGLKKIKEVANG